jgi:hypothetical protein
MCAELACQGGFADGLRIPSLVPNWNFSSIAPVAAKVDDLRFMFTQCL